MSRSAESERGKPAPRLLFGNAARAATSKEAAEIRPPAQAVQERPKRGCVYVKYIRLGEINVTVHLLGFAKPLNLKGYRASVAPFVKQRKIGSWRRMAVKLEKHLAFTLGNQQLSNFSSAVKSRIGRAQADSATEEGSAPSDRPATQKRSLLFGRRK